jgi:hypothetical protein
VRVLYVIIGCDTDPDRVRFLDRLDPGGLSWRGMLEGIPRAKDLLRRLTDHRGHAPIFTWVLRVDEQVREVHGAYEWVLFTYRDFLLDLENSGDELGWHPHFWRRDMASGRWYQELDDLDWQVEMLKRAYRAFEEQLPGRALSVRMGWAYHNNRTFQTLDALGVKVEFSAIPGLRTLFRNSPTRGENLFDWLITPRTPYYPSREDFRRPPRGREAALNVLEIPSFTSRSFFWSLISGLQMMRKMKSPRQLFQALRRPTFSVNLTGRPRLFVPLTNQLRRELRKSHEQTSVFSTYLHADELLENKSSLYSLEAMRHNLEAIIRVCDAEGVAVEFARAQQIPELISSGTDSAGLH